MKQSANVAWDSTLHNILLYGTDVGPRGKNTLEIIGHQVDIDMTWPVITVPARKLGYRFMCAEAAWILSGDDRVETIAPYSKTISEFSDDGIRFFGAYGPRYREQLLYVVSKLKQDPMTRQAVMSIWRENPPHTKDVPCTLDYQFLIRGAQLHMIVNMRSNDAWLGFPYDVFSATMVAAHVLLHLIEDRPHSFLRLGTLIHRAGSRHLYEKDVEPAKEIVNFTFSESATLGGFKPERQFQKPGDLINHLWALARLDYDGLKSDYLKEVIP